MAKEYAKAFYSSKRWQDTRNAYAAARGHLCERCLARGEYRPGEIVHHKIELTPANISRPEVALSWNNLELVCRRCHAEEHGQSFEQINERKRKARAARQRFVVDPDGKVHSRNETEHNRTS